MDIATSFSGRTSRKPLESFEEVLLKLQRDRNEFIRIVLNDV